MRYAVLYVVLIAMMRYAGIETCVLVEDDSVIYNVTDDLS